MPPLLQVENLSVETRFQPILRDVSLEIAKGETWGVVGASGAGKSMLARSITGLFPRGVLLKGGRVLYHGRDLLEMKESDRRRLRGTEIGFLVQNTASGLDPVYTVGRQMAETLIVNQQAESRAEALEKSADWLKKVGFSSPERILASYPHFLSGGMAQRVYLAMVFMLNPELVIADEFSTGMDATTEKEMLGLLFQAVGDSSLMMITHNILLLGGLTDKTAVMIGGVVVEAGPTKQVLEEPLHGYSQALLGMDTTVSSRDAGQLGMRDNCLGCPFANRCDDPPEECFSRLPEVKEIDGRRVRCHRY